MNCKTNLQAFAIGMIHQVMPCTARPSQSLAAFLKLPFDLAAGHGGCKAAIRSAGSENPAAGVQYRPRKRFLIAAAPACRKQTGMAIRAWTCSGFQAGPVLLHLRVPWMAVAPRKIHLEPIRKNTLPVQKGGQHYFSDRHLGDYPV